MGRILSLPTSTSTKFRTDRRMYFNAGSYTFVVPDGVYELFGVVIGAGGGGDGGFYGNGGAGGGYASGVLPVTPGQSLAVIVGSGGLGSGGSPQAGTSSSLGSFLTATGGGGANYGSWTNATVGTGSTSGVTSAFTSSGGTCIANANSFRSGGGGSSGTPFGNGKNAIVAGANYSATGGAGWGTNQLTPTYAQYMGQGGGGMKSSGAESNVTTPRLAKGGDGNFTSGGDTSAPDGKTIGVLTGTAIWWFPWEGDGSGGVGSGGNGTAATNGGNGGFGSGGGTGVGSPAVGGSGGFGGGGGSVTGSSSGLSTVVAGNGGVGGGGAGCHVGATGGNGGNGCVLIYW